MNAYSVYDRTSCSRTRLKNDNGEIEARLGVFNGHIWFDSKAARRTELKNVFDDAIDQVISTSFLLKHENGDMFGLVGFFKGGKGAAFHSWYVRADSQPVEIGLNEHLARFGAATLIASDAQEKAILVADGLGRKQAVVWKLSLKVSEEEAPVHNFEARLITKISCKCDITALGFDSSSNKLVCASGEEESKVFGYFDLTTASADEKKNKFEALKTSDLNVIFGAKQLAEGFLARDYAFRHPKERNDQIGNWEYVFPVGRNANNSVPAPLRQDMVQTQVDAVQMDSEGEQDEAGEEEDAVSMVSSSGSSTEEHSGVASQGRRVSRKRNLQPSDVISGKQRSQRPTRATAQSTNKAGAGGKAPTSLESLSKQVRSAVDSQIRLEQTCEYIMQTQERILGVLSMLRQQVSRTQVMVENRSSSRSYERLSNVLASPVVAALPSPSTVDISPFRQTGMNINPPDSAVAAGIEWALDA